MEDKSPKEMGRIQGGRMSAKGVLEQTILRRKRRIEALLWEFFSELRG